MLLYRVLSALVGIPVIILAVKYGGLAWTGVILVIAVAGVLEMHRLWQRMGLHPWLPGTVLGGLLLVAAAHFGNTDFLGAAIFMTILATIGFLVAVYPNFSFSDLAATLFTPIYAGWLLAHMLYIRQLPNGFHYVLMVLVATWSTDTFAYFVGVNFGKRKLAPVVSPNKSIEGSLGGVLGSIVAAVITGLLGGQLPVFHYVFLGLLVGVAGQVGDLAESAFKRTAGVKDSGRLIPGHGGVLDRFDSLYFTAPLVYYYIKMFTMY